MIKIDVVLVDLDACTAFCSDGVTRPFHQMYDREAELTESIDDAIAASVKVSEGQYILLRLFDLRSPPVN